MRKRIAVLTAQPEENTQSLFMEGFAKEAYDHDFDVCVFGMHMKTQDTAFREQGDSNIFNLINYDEFDAVVVLADVIQTTGVEERIEEHLHKTYQGPVIFIEKDSKYFPTIHLNHYKSFKNIMDHLIEVHQYKDIVFLNGWKEHLHSVEREKSYRDSLAEHGIPVKEENIYYGTYWYTSGKDFVSRFLASGRPLPDAIACANDCMAIGVAAELFDNGIRIPEDVAVVGYDSSDEGKGLTRPLTSADIPSKACGTYAVQYLNAIFTGADIPEFKSESPICLGESCGCKKQLPFSYGVAKGEVNIWDTDLSSAGYNAYYNSFVEELLSQHDHKGFFNEAIKHVYQIKPFNTFSICMNDYWRSSKIMNGDVATQPGYTDSICRALKCEAGSDVVGAVGFDDTFDVEKMIPELYEKRDHAELFYFSPLFFDNKSFGYAVISFTGGESRYTSVYRNWLKSLMQSMEAFYRYDGMRAMLERMESTQIRDGLTGLYNYKGFLKQAESFTNKAREEGKDILVVSLDIAKLRDINACYGRDAGDTAIIKLSQIVSKCARDNGICARTGNDEFVLATIIDSSADETTRQVLEAMFKKIDKFNDSCREPFNIEICNAIGIGMASDAQGLDRLVNDTIVNKNNRKAAARRASTSIQSGDEKLLDEHVSYILDNNKLIYHFQPIINARTGDVFAYEALMRADTERKISPLELIASAERLGRLYDVEKATFFNVVKYLEENIELFGDKKVFINSIPGCQLSEEDSAELDKLLSKYSGQIVVELTEETEMSDHEYEKLRTKYDSMNIETAVDDYGSGYSNVNNLLKYMPRFVKIDRMLMMDIHESPQKQHFVKDVIEFAHDNDIFALAEGVETSLEMKEVIKLGVDLIQGYYTSRPQAQVVRTIDQRVANEIVQYNQAANSKYLKKNYDVYDDEIINMVSLALNKYTGISVENIKHNENPVILKGSHGFQSNLRLFVRDCVKGTIVLDSVSLSGGRGLPCIELGQNVDLTLLLEDDNELLTGGIQVPESSKLTIVGDGNLTINLNSGKYYGIGNSIDAANGEINFNQDGGVIINANGMKGIGIGSGLGGKVNINRGHYELDLKGQEGVCIGSIDGAADISIEYCDLNIYSGISVGSIIGSVNNDANIKLENISGSISGSGNIMSGIGTLDGENLNVNLSNINIDSNIRARECYGIGCRNGETDIKISYARVKSVVQGKAAVAIGNAAKTAKIFCSNADVNTNAVTDFGSDMGANESDIRLENGRAEFILNGEEIVRDTIISAL